MIYYFTTLNRNAKLDYVKMAEFVLIWLLVIDAAVLQALAVITVKSAIMHARRDPV